MQILPGTCVIRTAKADRAWVQGFNMAVQKASTQLPQNPAELDRLIKARLNSDLKARLYTHACMGNRHWLTVLCSLLSSSSIYSSSIVVQVLLPV